LLEHLLVELVNVVTQVGDAVTRFQVEVSRDIGAGHIQIEQAAPPFDPRKFNG
jgi:hypothetical protein